MDEAAVAALRRFALHGDTAANQELLHLIDHSLDVGGTNAAQTVTPQLLRWSLEDTTAQASASTLLYVAVLNRHFCVRVVLDHLAQPLDRRPTGLDELQQLYVAAARLTAHSAAGKQLVQCVACLLIVLEDHLADRLCFWIRGGSGDGASFTAEDCCLALHIFIAVVDLLVDRRVPIGSIRRATQRRQLQEHLSIVLQSPLNGEEDMQLLVRATDTAVRFLAEAIHGEPQEVAEAFWSSLPTSTVWRHCVGCLAGSTTPCPEGVLDLVCDVLRSLTVLDAPAETILLEALPAVLQPVTSPSTADWETMSRVIAAALEASTEAIITEQPPDRQLFLLFSSAAERLVQVLQAPTAPSSAVNHVCEGISALVQVLQPAPIPEMDPTDDPEDFQEVVGCMKSANATKAAAMVKLRPFLVACETALATRLAKSDSARAGWRSIADYVTQRLLDGEAEDFQIVHEEVMLALYTTYERLSRLLGPLTAPELHSIAAAPDQQLLLVMVCADLTLQWLQSVEPSALLLQAVLLPSTVARYVVGVAPACSIPHWSADASLTVLKVLLHAVSFYHEHAVCDSGDVVAVLAVTEAAVKVVEALLEAGLDVAQLRQSCAPLAALLWHCVTSGGQCFFTVQRCHSATHQLSTLLLRGVAALPDSAVPVLTAQSPYTQAILLSSGGATNTVMDTLEALAHTLDCLAQLEERSGQGVDDVESAVARVLDSVVARVRRHVEMGEWPADNVASMLDRWHARCPQLVLCFLKLAATISAPLQPSLMLEGFTRFFRLPESRDVSTPDLVSLLSLEFLEPIAATLTTTQAFFPLLRWLLQPHPAFTVADGGRRVHALAMCGRIVCEGTHPLSLPEVVETLRMCIARWQDFVAAMALSSPERGNNSDGANDDGGVEDEAQVERRVLEELAVWSRRVAELTQLPANAPGWLASLRCAQDDYERMEVLKNI
ncbi:hypothetical protein ABL78_5426 [Leptomonas seymouri]|uniref:Exportin-1/Importin-beta-like domain-containing protein n=1 Tax=Leptomonas seymouri TaxID=5684 RepID=A0A0N0P4N6_LEPSE|nr:hypothetical protein ABL78_5426 [Leptomonas seymouri]|eukprot:KPI85506.1 hypothetical protein ABL78_5426 [Leptomonas seymouri]